MIRGLAIASLLILGAACGGSTAPQVADLPAPPAPATRATLAGPLCEGTSCRCRGAGDDVGQPSSPRLKRYEFKIGPVPNDLWVLVDDMVLYKSRERATECFYVDLYEGDHPVAVRVRDEPALAARLEVSEMAPEGKGWYDTFDFACGGPGVCDFEQLNAWRASLDKYTRGIHDPCGSTKIRGVKWQTGRAPDRIHPTDLRLDFVLQVYKFQPEHPPGHPACKDRF